MLKFHTQLPELLAFFRHFSRLFALFKALSVFSGALTLAPASIYRCAIDKLDSANSVMIYAVFSFKPR